MQGWHLIILIHIDVIKEVALDYGFKKPILPNEIMNWDKSVWPFSPIYPLSSKPLVDISEESISAIMMFHDSRDWGRDAQICTDILLSDQGKYGSLASPSSPQSIPFYLSNADLLWSNDFPNTRFAQGAFLVVLNALYQKLTGRELQATKFGKPEHVTYQYALRVFEMISGKSRQDLEFYAIGGI